MNIENAKKLVDQLERLPDEKFDMSRWINHHCGTVACIAGWCSLLNGGPTIEEKASQYFMSYGGENVFRFAADWLSLGKAEAEYLFGGDWVQDGDGDLSEVSRADAIAELKRMITAAE